MSGKSNIIIRKAVIKDVKKIHKIINDMASQDLMLPRSLNQIYENIRDFYVCEIERKVIGCAALHVLWSNLAEVKSVAVRTKYQRQGLGRLLVNHCLEDAQVLGLEIVFALTYQPSFFEKLGFEKVSKRKLPHKIWTECIRCPKFPNCNEEAVMLQLKESDSLEPLENIDIPDYSE